MSEAAKKTDAPEAENRSAAKSQAIDQQLHDGDRDSLHTLPLALLPLNMPSLLRAKMLKDNHMRTMVELFTSGSGASGRMEVEALETVFDDTDEFKEDLAILEPMENCTALMSTVCALNYAAWVFSSLIRRDCSYRNARPRN